MVANTPYGLTDSRTGEILDLSPLRRPPRGPVTRRMRPVVKKRHRSQLAETMIVLGVFAGSSLTFWFSLFGA